MLTPRRLVAALSVAALAAGCGTAEDPPERAAAPEPAAPTEQAAPTPRLVLSYDGGLLVLDARTLEQIADVPVAGFVRLNPAHNGRHVLVSQSDGFAVFDTGVWTEAHGDHRHHYTAAPRLTDVRFGGSKPGHVVAHDGALTLFSDDSGAVEKIDPALLLADADGVEATAVTTTEPHHGVAVGRADGSLVVSVGNTESRSGIEILDPAGRGIAGSDECPGLHGSAEAADGVLTFGCEDGVLIVRGNEIRKVTSPDPYGRIGNPAGSAQSPVVLGDYKTDPDAELERPQQFTLINTVTAELTVVPLEASYSFRSLDRGPNGEAIILGTDGALHVYDPLTATRVSRFDVIDGWSEPDQWQSPMPNLHVQGGTAYVTEPATRRLVAVDLATGQRTAETTLGRPTIELTGVPG
ncbi:zinc metallochaperone AztD [[Mycobacterium] wendilense]|uniref:Zinc metallochaperone AztD n=1 Tax=[Mycobacterium] wendilense TaxID=3064284 RepID=A0ABN9NY07_9MYCO|nr:zinc metallochaperone AztD [Mycolicibacterium sp. MU0050]CAJ1582386.1 zinc metallochaperone AztD [Mycolicibacterium sp. MU0050]